jgi:predicted signal transduction protein with EAL and GGDEF domain
MSSAAAADRDALIATLPELILLLRRDGVVLDHNTGQGLGTLLPSGPGIGRNVSTLWSAPTATLLRQLTRKAIAQRAPVQARFEENAQRYEVRASAQGPDRAICVIRPVLQDVPEALAASGERTGPRWDRRSFMRRLHEMAASAALRETPLALAVITLDGLSDIASVIDVRLADQVLEAAVLRLWGAGLSLPAVGSAEALTGESRTSSSFGQLSDNSIGLIIASADRELLGRCLGEVCANLGSPVSVGGNDFHLTAYAGVAVLGEDATTAEMLLEHARRAAAEARSRGTEPIRFFSDSLQLESLARLDIARELRTAIAQRDIHLRYVSRHELSSGRRVAWVGYLRWKHPLRGEIRPSEFLRVAEATGLALTLSRALLSGLRQDFLALCVRESPDVRLSFGPLRHHVLHESFVPDIEALLAEGDLPPERLELRIAERAFLAHGPAPLARLAARGVRLIVDEAGRALSALEPLARAPLWAFQLDRAWVSALGSEDATARSVARKVCRSGIAIAEALELQALAPGVDNAAQRDALLELGCHEGLGDLYGPGWAVEQLTAPL